MLTVNTPAQPEPAHHPTIVLGMHRSGTTLVTRLLRDAGVFVGRSTNVHLESKLFLELNDWMLHSCGATWEQPQRIDVLDEHPAVRQLITSELRRCLGSPMALRYLGPTQWLTVRHDPWLPFPWGFKDPRTTFTLPLWLELFPGCKVIHVKRHGVDVAASLQLRAEGAGERVRKSRKAKLPDLMLFNTKHLARIPGGLAYTDLQKGLDLWETYTRRTEQHCAQLKSQALTIRYEELVLHPSDTLQTLAEFCGLNMGAGDARGIDPSRAYAYRASASEELMHLEQENKLTLAELGY